MFGGHCFLVNGNMLGAVTGSSELIIRVGAEDYRDALRHPFAREMDFTGRPMRGFVVVESQGFATAEDLKFWLEWSHAFASSLPAK
jgi:TfoX N-terminal domain